MSYIAERRLEEKERRRAEIVDAAEAAGREVGLDALTMDDVARRARLSRALLYVYFQDRSDLMFGLAERAIFLVDKAGITFPIVRDTDGAVAKAWGARIFPSSYLLDSRGRIRKVLVGEADWTSPPLVSTIRALF